MGTVARMRAIGNEEKDVKHRDCSAAESKPASHSAAVKRVGDCRRAGSQAGVPKSENQNVPVGAVSLLPPSSLANLMARMDCYTRFSASYSVRITTVHPMKPVHPKPGEYRECSTHLNDCQNPLLIQAMGGESFAGPSGASSRSIGSSGWGSVAQRECPEKTMKPSQFAPWNSTNQSKRCSCWSRSGFRSSKTGIAAWMPCSLLLALRRLF
jgi:hypothetical protein